MTENREEAPFAFPGLDRLFHERARLGIVTSLAGQAEGLAFSELKRLCGLTDGNLNRHLSALEEAGYVTIAKEQTKGRPVTTCRLTGTGRERFVEYLAELESVLRKGASATAGDPFPYALGNKA
ncbi:MAG: transcriptional regulator [Novosphingobium sp.]|nr:transcriptional regulator [Novosphingobium sp.]